MNSIDKNRKFGITFGAVFAVFGLLLLWRGRGYGWYFLVLAAIFIFLAYLLPKALSPIERGWMKLAEILMWFNTRLILGFVFFIVFTPVGFLLRLFGKDILDLKINKEFGTYWNKRSKNIFLKDEYENIF